MVGLNARRRIPFAPNIIGKIAPGIHNIFAHDSKSARGKLGQNRAATSISQPDAAPSDCPAK